MCNEIVKLFGFICLLCLLPLSFSSLAQTQTVVVLFGDSITVGFNSGRPVINGNGSTTLSGPRQFLSDILNNPAAPRSSTVVNWGAGGTPTTVGVARMRSNLTTTRADVDGDRFFVLIMYGTNDFGNGIGASTTAFNNRVMINIAREEGYMPVVGNITPRSDRDILPLTAEVFNAALASNAVAVDHFTAFSQRPLDELLEQEISVISGLPIRLHPNDTGYRIIAANWFSQALNVLIPRTDGTSSAPPIVAPIIQLILED